MSNYRILRAAGIGLGLVVSIGAAATQTADGAGSGAAPALTCSPETPVVAKDGTVTLRAWAKPREGRALEYSWMADAGKIAGGDHEVKWNLTGVPARPRPYAATVKVSLTEGGPAACTVQVFVAEEERGAAETGKSFLVKGAKEAQGYGLYSYLLLGSLPSATNRERYLKAIQAYLDTFEYVTALRQRFPASKLNIAYLPILVPAKSAPTAEWLLEKYDYARARLLLDTLPGNLREGPYLISTLKPLDGSGKPDQYLFQDLSWVPAKTGELVSWWVREFQNQAAQEHFWEPRTGELLVLKIRTTIGVLAEGLPDVQKSLGDWIAWLH